MMCTLNPAIHVMLKGGHHRSTVGEIRPVVAMVWERGDSLGRGKKELSGMTETFCALFWVVGTQIQ